MTSIYTPLIADIASRLGAISAIKKVYDYPANVIEQYPAAIFFPDTLENAFETNRDNMKTYRFKLYIVVGSAQKEKVDIFSTVLPKAVDAVLEAFDAAWDGGTIDGNRVWCVISAGSWTMAPTEKGLEAQAELTLDFRALTSN